MDYSQSSHLQHVCSEWAAIRTLCSGDSPVSVSGNALSIADVVAVSLYVCSTYIYYIYSLLYTH